MMLTTYSVPSGPPSDLNAQDRPPELRRGVEIPKMRGVDFEILQKGKMEAIKSPSGLTQYLQTVISLLQSDEEKEDGTQETEIQGSMARSPNSFN